MHLDPDPFKNFVDLDTVTTLFQTDQTLTLSKVWWHAATLFVYFLLLYTFVNTFIQFYSSVALAERTLFFLINVRSIDGLH
jgi:hypothetical protein